VLLLISALAVGRWKSRPYLLALVLVSGMLVPVLGLVQVGSQARADRFTYLPQLGIFCALTWLAIDLWPAAQRRALAVCAGLALAACALLTARNLLPWMDTVSLFEHAAAVTKNNACAHTNAGLAHARLGDEATRRLDYAGKLREYGAAIAHYQASLPHHARPAAIWNQLGAALTRIGRQPDANEAFRTVLRLDFKDITARYNLATGLAKTGATDDAIAQFEQSSAFMPDFARATTTSPSRSRSKGRTADALPASPRSRPPRPRRSGNQSRPEPTRKPAARGALTVGSLHLWGRFGLWNPFVPHLHWTILLSREKEERFREKEETSVRKKRNVLARKRNIHRGRRNVLARKRNIHRGRRNVLARKRNIHRGRRNVLARKRNIHLEGGTFSRGREHPCGKAERPPGQEEHVSRMLLFDG